MGYKNHTSNTRSKWTVEPVAHKPVSAAELYTVALVALLEHIRTLDAETTESLSRVKIIVA